MCCELIGCWMGVRPAQLQAAEFDAMPEPGEQGDYPGAHGVPRGGMGTLVHALAAQLGGVSIEQGCEV